MLVNVDRFWKSKLPDNENCCWKSSPRVLIVDLVLRHHGNDIFKPIQFFWTILRFNRIQKPFFQFFLGDLLQNLTQQIHERKVKVFTPANLWSESPRVFLSLLTRLLLQSSKNLLLFRLLKIPNLNPEIWGFKRFVTLSSSFVSKETAKKDF